MRLLYVHIGYPRKMTKFHSIRSSRNQMNLCHIM